ncbi:hypothetical protein B4087_1783 [Bacillus cereus]|nr:hypothetical protein B4087_1783 [Bacillus cereus]
MGNNDIPLNGEYNSKAFYDGEYWKSYALIVKYKKCNIFYIFHCEK